MRRLDFAWLGRLLQRRGPHGDAQATPATGLALAAPQPGGAAAAMIEALQQTLQQEQAASRAKSQFLERLGHEIRTPLNGVSGIAQLLAGTALDDGQRSYVEVLQRSTASLIELIDRLLEFARMEAGEFALRAQDVDLRALLDEVVAGGWPRALAKGLLLECHLAPDLPLCVHADPVRLRQIVNHLLDNALEFTRVGQVVVAARRHGQGLVIEVSDTGIGIAREQQSQVFAPFVQVDASLARPKQGLGLGLALTRVLVQSMGGRVELESEAGRGALFRVHLALPVRPAPPAAAAAASPLRVGLVSDAPASRQALRDRIRHLGHELVASVSWRDLASAPDTLAAMHPQCVLYDEPLTGWPGHAPQASDEALPWRAVLLQRAIGSAPRRAGLLRLLRPCDDMALAHALDPAAVEAADSRPSETPAKPKGHALLVEDHEVNQEVGRAFLQRLGYEVDVAGNGPAALAALHARDYVVLLVDCQMPGMDGFELTRRIRAGEAGLHAQRTPIIALTAHTKSGDRERGLATGMNDYLNKPVSLQHLDEAINRWLVPGRN